MDGFVEVPKTFSTEQLNESRAAVVRNLEVEGINFHLWGGACHGFDVTVPEANISQESIATRDRFIRRALAA